MWWKAGNASILVKLTFVDKPSTPRERARRLRREQTEAERFLWARLRARQLPRAKPYSVILRVPRGESRVLSSVRDTLCLIDSMNPQWQDLSEE